MRAAIVTRFGAPDVLEVSEMPDPIPGCALFRRRQYAESTITIATKTPIAMRVPVRLLILRFLPHLEHPIG